MAQLTAERVREILIYDQETGIFHWTAGQRRAGKLAGHVASGGYIQITVGEKNYMAHRLAWVWMTGKWPTKDIDHKDTIRGNNRWANLREATKSQNSGNGKRRSNNTSGFKGVYFHKKDKKYRVSIVVRRKRIHLGGFATAEDGAAAYIAAAKLHFGEFARAA